MRRATRPVPVEEGVHPEKPVMGTGRSKDRLDPAGKAVGLVHPFEKTRQRARADGNVPPDFDMARAQLAGRNGNFFARLRVLDKEKLWRQEIAEAAVNLDDRRGRGRRFRHAVFVDPFLDSDMRLGFELKVPLLRIGAVVVAHRALDVDGMGVVPFDEVAVVAVHRPHEIGERLSDGRWQAAAESGGLLRKLKR
ncbi:MAG: hypothetical protein OXC66_12285 [Roseovarius sp.]|nr:hypothetical protein [Roseovarius sp.]